jgi:hypothetical protein
MDDVALQFCYEFFFSRDEILGVKFVCKISFWVVSRFTTNFCGKWRKILMRDIYVVTLIVAD